MYAFYCTTCFKLLNFGCIKALCGEIGELCEIFQWTGPIVNPELIETKKIIHIGEEVADVMLYSIRLSDLCGVDIAKSTLQILELNIPDCNNNRDWTYFCLDSAHKYVADYYGKTYSKVEVRMILFRVQHNIGLLSALFAKFDEARCRRLLEDWTYEEKLNLSEKLGMITVELFGICNIFGLKISDCLLDKISKNEKKYPAELVMGSSAKYNEYHDLKRVLSSASSTESSKVFLPNAGKQVIVQLAVILSFYILRNA